LANQNINNTVVQNAVYSYWVYENAIDKKICQKIINLGKKKWIEGKVQNRLIDENWLDKKQRESDVSWSDDEWLYKICWQHLLDANKNANWNFQISACEPMQITRYKKNGHYDFHFDGNGFTRMNMPEDKFLHGNVRKLSMTIVLNENYEGGEFEFFHNGTIIKAKMGTIIVFPSYFVHRVRPVTKGTRYSLVAWFCGQPFK
jgi:PKHD-type hydroxylase